MKLTQGVFIARLLVALLLVAAAIGAGARDLVPSIWPLLAVAGFMLLYNFFQLVRPALTTRAALVLDVIAITAYLNFSGDIENPMRSAYALPVVAGAIIVSTRFAFALALTSILTFGAMVYMTLVDASPVRLEHHHLAMREAWALHDLIDPDENPDWLDYVGLHFGYLSILLFGGAYGFGTLAKRIRLKEQELARENVRLVHLLGTLPEGVALLKQDGDILIANPEARKLLSGKSISSLEPEFGLLNKMADLDQRTAEFEIEYGGRILNNILARSSPDDPIVWVFRDQTERRRLMAKVVHQSKMADLGLLAAGIAHEIGNPLSSMSAILQVVLMKEIPEEISGRLHSLGSHIDRIHRIVRDISAFARPSAGKKGLVDIRHAVENTLQIFAMHKKAKDIEVAVTLPEEVIILEVVEDQVVQTILNLLLNAADASNSKAAIQFTLDADAKEVRFSIQDFGAGISEEDRANLFAPFFTTKDPGDGVGLGLFICDSIVRAHRGRIEVDSDPGKGSTFTVYLPRDERK